MHESNEAVILTDPVASATCPKCGMMLDVDGIPAFEPVQCPTCEFMFEIPARFGTFMLLQQLGTGGMGGVYRARDEALNREVAIKVMLKSLGDDPQFVESFQREAQAAAKLNHPNIAQIYSFGQEKGQPYIAMELVSGGSLDKMMAEKGPMDPAAVIKIGSQIAEGLREAAEAGLVHGDVKPENILFDQEKNAKLVDFGLAALASGPGLEVWGTPYYIAPEKVRRQKCDFRADIYSLGGTLYHAIAGVPPFEGEDATAVVKARFDAPPKSMREIRPGVPDEVETMVVRMLELEPQKRYPTYGSLLGDMRRYLQKAGPVNLVRGSKKIVLKGKRGNVTSSLPMTGGMAAAAEKQAAPAEEKRGNGCLMLGLITVGVFLLLSLIIGGLIGYKFYSGVKGLAKEGAQLAEAMTSASASAANSMAKVRESVAKAKPHVETALSLAKEAEEMVVAVLGEDSRAGLVPPEPVFEIPAAAPAGTNDTAAAEGGTNAVAEAAAEEPESSAEEAGAELDEDMLPVVKLVREMYTDAYAMKAAVALAEHRMKELEAKASETEKMQVAIATDGSKGDVTAAIEAGRQTLTKMVEHANSVASDANTLMSDRALLEMPRRIDQMRKTLRSVRSDLAALEARIRREADAAERRRKVEEDDARKREAAEAEEAKAAEETERVAGVEAENAEKLRSLQFREASRALREISDGLTTTKGRQAYDAAQERIERIKEFHAFIVGKVAEGYRTSRSGVIASANEKQLVLNGQKVNWPKLYEEQLVIFSDFLRDFVPTAQDAKDMRLRERVRMMTNAALFMKLFYSSSTSAMERAKDLAVAAAELLEVDAATVHKLIPEFFE